MFKTAEELSRLAEKYQLPLIYKSSFDKANRTSLDSYRGPGLKRGLKILSRIKQRYKLPLITDIHLPQQAEPVAEVVDFLQIPAFLCRQTDLLVAAARTGLPVNLKKGQFLDPDSLKHSVEKLRQTAHHSQLMVTERGSFFGYNRWVVDMRNLVQMRETGAAVVYDATHSVQLPGGKDGSSGGQRQFIFPLARAAVATGIDGIFMEIHPQPETARCDADNMLPLKQLEPIIKSLVELHQLTRNYRKKKQSNYPADEFRPGS